MQQKVGRKKGTSWESGQHSQRKTFGKCPDDGQGGMVEKFREGKSGRGGSEVLLESNEIQRMGDHFDIKTPRATETRI